MLEFLANLGKPKRRRRIIISIDAEARASVAPPGLPADRLFEHLMLGNIPGYAPAGIGLMMDIAEKYGVSLTVFYEFCEALGYGDVSMATARDIHRRGHDLQIHAHADSLPADFRLPCGEKVPVNMLNITPEMAEEFVAFLVGQYRKATGANPIGFRAGAYRYNQWMLEAFARQGVIYDSSYNANRPDKQPVVFGAQRQFKWENGTHELPISCVSGYRRSSEYLEFNFNSEHFSTLDALVEYLDRFYAQFGDDAIAVMLMHSWSLLNHSAKAKTHDIPAPEAISRFEALIGYLAENRDYEVITTRDLHASQTLRETLFQETYTFTGERVTEHTETINSAPTFNPMPEVAVKSQGETFCPICATSSTLYEATGENEPTRLCPDCRGAERHRAIAVAIRDFISEEFSLDGANVLLVANQGAEKRLLKAYGAADITTIDIRPEVHADLTGNLSAMPEIADDSFDIVFASSILRYVHDYEGALDEIRRVLKPGGRFFSYESLEFKKSSTDITDAEKLTRWYGEDAYERYKVGAHRLFGDLDFLKDLQSRFVVKTFYTRDPHTQLKFVTHVCAKATDWPRPPVIAEPDKIIAQPVVIESERITCPICNTPSSQFILDGQMCPDCRGCERHRAIAVAFKNFIIEEFPLFDKSILMAANHPGEKRMLQSYGPAEVTTIDVRPEVNPDIVGNIADMHMVADARYDVVFACGILRYVEDYDNALQEIYRVLKPGGRFFSYEGIEFTGPTVPITDLEKIMSAYGQDDYERYKVGAFRYIGDLDYICDLQSFFVVKTFYARDPVSNCKAVLHSATKHPHWHPRPLRETTSALAGMH